MPTKETEIGPVYYAIMDGGEMKKLGKLTSCEVSVIEDDTLEFPEITLETMEGTFEIKLTRKDKKIWAKILGMPKWMETEWVFQRKKRRASNRRRRRARRLSG